MNGKTAPKGFVYDDGFGARDVSEALTVKVDGTIHLKGQTGPDT